MRNEGLLNQLHEAQTIIQDYKTKQNIAGDSWTMYRTESQNEWDIELTGLNTTNRYLKRWKVTYQIDGGRKIPNAFAIFYPKISTGKLADYAGGTGTVTTGFGYNDDISGEDPLVNYFMIHSEHNWTANTDSYIKVKFRALSPYKGRIIFEEIQ